MLFSNTTDSYPASVTLPLNKMHMPAVIIIIILLPENTTRCVVRICWVFGILLYCGTLPM